MTSYYRIYLGKANSFAQTAKEGNFIGADFGIDQDLSNVLPENWRDFNKAFIPVFLEKNPEKTKIAAGLACGNLWVVSKGINIGDYVLCPDGTGSYSVGEITGNYEYHPGKDLPHRRNVKWLSSVPRANMSQELSNSCGSIATVANITKHTDELSKLIEHPEVTLTASDTNVESPTAFALEKHLEEFLVHNWSSTELGKKYDIYVVDGDLVGQQFPSDTGPIDILAISKDSKELLVVELKRGRASDVVVGQIQRYMGYIKDELAESYQEVRGVIIAHEDDLRIRRALSVATGISFMTYQISFTLGTTEN